MNYTFIQKNTNINETYNKEYDINIENMNLFLNENNDLNDKNKINKNYTLTFATMCKNEEHCILEALESVYKYIDYWVICDTGSTDNTVNLIKLFFSEKNIDGELYIDEWVSFSHNKTLLFNRCKNKMDFFIHFDADDILVGDLPLTIEKNKLAFYINIKRGTFTYKDIFIYNSKYSWKGVGIAHTVFNCIDNYEQLEIGSLVDCDFYLHSRDIGARSYDTDKYLKDAKNLEKQFFDTLLIDEDNINGRSLFYTAQSYYELNDFKTACNYYCLYTKLKNTWDEELYESYKRIIICLIQLNYSNKIIIYYANRGIKLFPERAEIYFILSNYFKENNNYELAFFNIINASECDYNKVNSKFTLFVDYRCYGKYLYFSIVELSYLTKRFDYGKEILKLITDETEQNILKLLYDELNNSSY